MSRLQSTVLLIALTALLSSCGGGGGGSSFSDSFVGTWSILFERTRDTCGGGEYRFEESHRISSIEGQGVLEVLPNDNDIDGIAAFVGEPNGTDFTVDRSAIVPCLIDGESSKSVSDALLQYEYRRLDDGDVQIIYRQFFEPCDGNTEGRSCSRSWIAVSADRTK